MTQNNEREALLKTQDFIERIIEHTTDDWAKTELREVFNFIELSLEKKPILQNEQQESVTNLWEALGKWSAYLASNGEQANLAPPSWLIDAVSSATSPPKQIPDGWKLIGKASEMGVVWHKQNPHAHPVGTEFYAVLPTTSLTSETNTEVGNDMV